MQRLVGLMARRGRGVGIGEMDNRRRVGGIREGVVVVVVANRGIVGSSSVCGGTRKGRRGARLVIGALAWASARLAMQAGAASALVQFLAAKAEKENPRKLLSLVPGLTVGLGNLLRSVGRKGWKERGQETGNGTNYTLTVFRQGAVIRGASHEAQSLQQGEIGILTENDRGFCGTAAATKQWGRGKMTEPNRRVEQSQTAE